MRLRYIVALLILAAPSLALAQAKDATQSYDRSTPGSSNIRNFTLRNTAANTITEARVRLSDDSTRVLTETGPITKSHNPDLRSAGQGLRDGGPRAVRGRAQPGGQGHHRLHGPDHRGGRTGASWPKGRRPPGRPRPVQVSPAN